MNYLLHRQRTPGAVIKVPDELKELMSEISRKVLREQPPNVINFIADYLEAKLIRRENQVVATKVVDNVLDISLDIVELLDEVGLTAEKAERVVQMFREAFRKHFHMRTSDESLRDAFREGEVLRRLVEECEFTEQEALKTGKVIERAYKTYFLRNVYKDYHGPAMTSDWKDAAKHTLGIYAASGATKEEMEQAAVRIQAAYRGYYTRKREEMDRKAGIIQKAYRKHQTKQLVSGVLDEIIDDAVDPKLSGREEVMWIVNMVLEGQLEGETVNQQKMDEAAVKIQSAFRGKQVRKQLREDDTASNERQISKIPLDSRTDPPPRSSSVEDLEKAAILAQSVARGHLTRRQIQKEKAAIQIQSHARGHLTRKNLAQNQMNKPSN